MSISGTITLDHIDRPAPQQPAPVPKPPAKPSGNPVLQAKAFKITAVIEAEAIASLNIPNAQPRLPLRIATASRTFRVELAAKSLRKVQAALAAAGPDGLTIIVQGRLEGEHLLDAGIAAQPRTPKAVQEGA
jgi:hypothetical protein